MTITYRKRTAAAMCALALAFAGCSAKDGAAGAPGRDGTNGTDGTDGTNGSSVGSIKVTVYGADGAALADATVTTIPSTSSSPPKTAADGTVTLTNIPIGTWLVTANKLGLKADGASVTVVANGTSTATLRLKTGSAFALARVVGIPAGYKDNLPAGEARFTYGTSSPYSTSVDIKTNGVANVPVKQYVYLQAAPEDAKENALTVQSWKISTSPNPSAAPALEYWDGTSKPRTWDTTSTTASNARFRPNLPGAYTVTITASSSAGNFTYDLPVYAGTYVGAAWCASCHSNAGVVGEGKDVYGIWSMSGHATKFENMYDATYAGSPGGSCIQCHVTGLDESTVGGFDDMARQAGWNPATASLNQWMVGQWGSLDQFVADSRTLPMQKLAGIQCESCHGPGSNHPSAESHMSWDPSVCAQCHSGQPAQWALSKHSVPVPLHMTSSSCMPCHSGQGFVVSQIQNKPIVSPDQSFPGYPATVFETGMAQVIGCVTCHDPHFGTGEKSAQLRLESAKFTAPMGFTVDAGESAACKKCHIDKRDTKYYADFLAGKNARGPHMTQTDMIAGKGGAEFSGKTYTSSFHTGSASGRECTTCHMYVHADALTTDCAAGFTCANGLLCSSDLKCPTCGTNGTTTLTCGPAETCSHGACTDQNYGGHTFNMKWTDPSTSTTYEHLSSCNVSGCHSGLTKFDRTVDDKDYANGTTTIPRPGIQTQIGTATDTVTTTLLGRLGSKLKTALGKQASDPVPESVSGTLTEAQRQAFWNFWYVANDGSRGVHNTDYAVQLLCDSLKALDASDPCTRP